MQQRHKWQNINKNVNVDDVVLIFDEIMPPAKWPLARVVRIYKGPDGLVRVVDLRTGSSELKRPVHKLVPLNVLNNEEDLCT